jgi:predicted signal transduction protein with EAL and GGDEF domain
MVLDGPPDVLHGCRALSRWAHPRLGWIDPRYVLPLAGRSKRTAELDRWAVDNACSQLRRWRREGLGHFVVRVALGPALLQGVGEAARIRSTLQAAGLQGSDLELEITVDGSDALDGELHAEIEALQRFGVRVLMQDPEAEADSRFLGAFLPEFQIGEPMEADRLSEWARHIGTSRERPVPSSGFGRLAAPNRLDPA